MKQASKPKSLPNIVKLALVCTQIRTHTHTCTLYELRMLFSVCLCVIVCMYTSTNIQKNGTQRAANKTLIHLLFLGMFFFSLATQINQKFHFENLHFMHWNLIWEQKRRMEFIVVVHWWKYKVLIFVIFTKLSIFLHWSNHTYGKISSFKHHFTQKIEGKWGKNDQIYLLPPPSAPSDDIFNYSLSLLHWGLLLQQMFRVVKVFHLSQQSSNSQPQSLWHCTLLSTDFRLFHFTLQSRILRRKNGPSSIFFSLHKTLN